MCSQHTLVPSLYPVLGIRNRNRIRVRRIRMFLGLPDPDPLVRGMDPDPDPDPDPALDPWIRIRGSGSAPKCH
jgi:hypothetical protein